MWNKMHLNSILKGNLLRLKTFEPITTAANKDNKSFQFCNGSHRGWLLWHLDSEEILLKMKTVDWLKIDKYTATWSFGRFSWSSQSEVWYNNSKVVQKLAPFCIPCRVVLSFLNGLLLKVKPKVIETKTALTEWGEGWRSNKNSNNLKPKYVSNVLQDNQTRTFETKLCFLNPHFLL